MIAAPSRRAAIISKAFSSLHPQAQREKLIGDVFRLLRRDHEPLVRVDESTVPNAGKGVFAMKDVLAGTGLCLYPGVFTPPLPVIQILDAPEDVLLADSGLERNAYVLTLQSVGGQLDAEPVVTATGSGKISNIYREVVENPSACGHLANHPNNSTRTGQEANVEVFSFTWDDPALLSQFDGDVVDRMYGKPNKPRADGSPWYLDGSTGTIVYFPLENNRGTEQERTRSVGGAILYTSKDVREGDELFLDYKLRYPYPDWAKDWYEPCA